MIYVHSETGLKVRVLSHGRTATYRDSAGKVTEVVVEKELITDAGQRACTTEGDRLEEIVVLTETGAVRMTRES